MRKIDYTLLAQIIRDELGRCKKLPSSTPQGESAERIARRFAGTAGKLVTSLNCRSPADTQCYAFLVAIRRLRCTVTPVRDDAHAI